MSAEAQGGAGGRSAKVLLPDAKTEALAASAAFRRLRTRREEMLLAELEGVLMPVEDHARAMTQAAMAVKSGAAQMRHRVVPRIAPFLVGLSPAELDEILEAEERSFLQRLSAWALRPAKVRKPGGPRTKTGRRRVLGAR